ncbi:hypothetical protein FK178_07340 [Antarcticibacterium arcticum]|uniref:Uncharacterized protein n=1 Tax=Antarcticibacterium arcticum TaxID=2585771 RepID=A0A5B8YHX9_9FLAO|nr:hypothetical protein [Antarcticibacterium arcticum]QED37550.1 hypothetical protein FK178_07340 [Antarcticibacterium arcticum]
MKKLLLLSLVAAALSSCSVENEAMDALDGIREIDLSFEDEICGEETSHWYGDLGSVTVFNDRENLIVRIISTDPEGLQQARVEIVDNFGDFPANGGGQLPAGQMGEVSHVGGEWYTQFSFPLSNFANFEDNCLLIAPWAIFKGNGGTHWAGDQTAGNENNPWRYFAFCIQDCPPTEEPPVVICESAYMYSDDDSTLNKIYPKPANWGWYLEYDVSNAEESYPLYAAAGQNEISNGYHVGNVFIHYDSNGSVYAEIVMLGDYVIMGQHTFVGDALPSGKRPGPGQYTNTGDMNDDGKVFIIVHAEVCWEED